MFSLKKLFYEHRYTYHWISGQKPHLIKNGKRTCGAFFEITDVGFFFRRHARSVVLFAQICAFVLLVSTMLGLRAWGDDLNVVLFKFLEDDTKLAQSCTDWLYVQHWYTVVPDPAMRVTLWALMGVGDDCDKRTRDTPPHFFLFLVSF